MASMEIPTDWSAEQAMAVFELLDALREHVWAHYELTLIEAYRDDLSPDPGIDATNLPDDPLF